MTAPDLTEPHYLREIERLAHRVTVAAADEGWLSALPDPPDATPLRRGVNALARALRAYHFDGDGCLDEEDRPRVRLAGATLLKPGRMPAGIDDDYEQVCARLGVEPRPEGWALWNTWDDGVGRVTMVVTAVETTEGLFLNWSNGRAVDPLTPLPSQVALVRHGWIGPMTFSPRATHHMGLDGRPLPPE
jgi:hypothetical protein